MGQNLPTLNLPTNTGLSLLSFGFIPPLTYQGDNEALQPIKLTTLPYFLYIDGIYPSPVRDKKSKPLVYCYTTFVWGSDYIIV